nr:E3 ubiquitin-protein ligase TRIM56-like [Crassostrea gigas]
MSVLAKELGDDFLSCVLCQELLKDPRLLPCLHSICNACASFRLDKSDKFITCPICEDMVTIWNVENTYLNPWLKNIISVIKITQNSEGKFCSFCELKGGNQEAVATCLTCFDLLCKTCWESRHTFTTLTKEHHVVSIEEAQSGCYDSEIRSNQTICCSVHKNEYYKFFCKTCDVPICRDCTVLQHRSHDHISPKDALKHSELCLQKEIDRVEKGINQLKIQQSELDKQANDSENCEENLRIQIETTCNSMINKISAQRRSLEKSLTQSLKNPKEKTKLKTELAKNKIRLLERTTSFCKFLLKYGTDFEILSLQSLVMRRVKHTSVKFDQFPSSEYRVTMPRLSTSWKEPDFRLIFENGLNTVENETLPMETKSVQTDEEEKNKTVMGISQSENIDIGIQCNIIEHDILKGDKAVQTCLYSDMVIQCSLLATRCFVNLHQTPKISCLSWMTNDSFIAVDQCNSSVNLCFLAFSGNGMVLENCIDSTVTSWCIAVRTGSSEIIVLDHNWSKKNCVSNVSVLFATPPLSNLLACTTNYAISVFSHGMTLLKRLEFTDTKGNPLVLKDPRFGCIFSSGKFAVSDFDNDFVFIFDENARLFRKEFCFPGPIATDKDDLIYIADFYEHRIIVTNFEGSLRNTITLLPHVSHPRSISISSDHKLAVAFRNSVALFQLKIENVS